MNRLERVRKTVDSLLYRQPDESERRCGFVHLYGVSAVCALLAYRRGLDVEVCATAGMLHDLSSYETCDSTDHAQRSSSRAKELLIETGDFSPNEISAIAQAISTHSAKHQVDDSTAEVLKDADVLQHYLYNPSLNDGPETNARLKAVFSELGLE
jgi:uncharacterized protein